MAQRRVEVQLYSSKTSALEGGEWSAARPGPTLPPGKTPAHCTGGWVGPRAGLDGWKISPPPPPGFDPRTVQPVVAIPTELPGPRSTLSVA